MLLEKEDYFGPPLLDWPLRDNPLSMMVIGRGPPGGAWHEMAPDMQTLSPAYWMGLVCFLFFSFSLSQINKSFLNENNFFLFFFFQFF